MKVSKIIVPLLALTTLGNFNNNQTIEIRLEKKVKVPYEILSRENEYLINKQVVFEKFDSVETPISNSAAACEALYQSIIDTCNALTGAKKTACIAVAWNTYLACMAAPPGGVND